MLIIIAVAFFTLSILTLMLIPPSMGRVAPFTDENGNQIEGSIAEKCFLDVGQAPLGMFLMGKDVSNPVLLFLGGGPGIPEYLLEYEYPSGLSDEFVVCYLEYRGSSLSYSSALRIDDMTVAQYIQDAVGVTEYLRERFQQEKIYLMGHSFGTMIALKTAQLHPEYYRAYFAMSQICDQQESERIAYRYMIEQYAASGNQPMVRKLQAYPFPEQPELWASYARTIRDEAMHGLGVGTTREMDSVIRGIFLPSLRCRVYTPMERINIWRGKSFLAASEVSADASRFNAFEEVPSLSIPIYFFAGRYDYTCCYSLQEEYFNWIEAPKKEFYTFEKSAHSPVFEEPEKALNILREIKGPK